MARGRLALLPMLALALARPSIAQGRDATASPGPPTVRTEAGRVRGLAGEGVRRFLGIRYARPPAGPWRWWPPRPAAPWPGVRDATRAGAACAQADELGAFAGTVRQGEDCLFLNVTEPPAQAVRPRRGWPVLVWLHGGGLVAGEGASYDGGAFARGTVPGPVVVVTVNYRLGLFGFLAHPALDGEGHAFANYGLMDQALALRWVRRNIAAFGGDPGRVTIAGQSSGGSSVAALMIARGTKGLFHRAIFQSGLFLPIASVRDAEAGGGAFAVSAGCPAVAVPAAGDCLRKLTTAQVVALQVGEGGRGGVPIGFVADGAILPSPVADPWSAGAFRRVPVLSGTTADEGRFDASIDEMRSGRLSAAGYERLVGAMFPRNGRGFADDAAAAILARYPAARFDSPALALSAVVTDFHVCPIPAIHRAMARFVPVFAYEFADRDAPWYFPPQSFAAGAAHSADLQYLFPLWHGGRRGTTHALAAPQRELSRRLVAAWATFAYAGDPNGRGVPRWPRFAPGAETLLVQSPSGFRVEGQAGFNDRHQCAFWAWIRRAPPQPR